MIIQAITWQESLPIRHKVLWPNKPELFCQLEEDKESRHYGVFIDNQLVCVASLYSKTVNGISRARLKQFATLKEFQGKGIGTKLLKHILDDLKSHKENYIWCDISSKALDYYTRLGFETTGSKYAKANKEYYTVSLKLN